MDLEELTFNFFNKLWEGQEAIVNAVTVCRYCGIAHPGDWKDCEDTYEAED